MDPKDFYENCDSTLEEILSELEAQDAQEVIPEGICAEKIAAEEDMQMAPEEQEPMEEILVRHRRRIWPWIAGCAALLLLLMMVMGFYAYREVRSLADIAFSTIDEAQGAVDCVKSGDMEAFANTLISVDTKLDIIDESLDKPLWKLAAQVPGPGGDIKKLRALFGIWDQAYKTILIPAVSTLQSYPLPEDGENILNDVDRMAAYVELAKKILPACENCMDDFCDIPQLYVPQLEEKMAEVRALIETVRPFLPLLENVLNNAAEPVLETLRSAPLDSLLVSEHSISTYALRRYLILAETLVPWLEGFLEELESIENLPVDLQGAIGEKGAELIALYNRAEKYIPLLRMLIGDGEDREYLLAVQNAAEVRSTGGFPGCMGFITIKNDVLTMGEFSSVYEVLNQNANYRQIGYTPTEELIFFRYIFAPRDAGIIPHFPRVAEIWAGSVQSRHETEPEGVISLSPTIVQDFLEVVGELDLSDGTKLTAANATRVLQHDIYYKYFVQGVNSISANQQTDLLFAEAAAGVIEAAFSGLSVEKMKGFLDLAEKNFESRSIMLWMKDPEEQEVIEKLGCSGALNNDPEKPEIGVYFNGTVSSKLGWYLNMDVVVGEGRKNGDIMSWPVTITLENTLSMEEYVTSNPWLVGLTQGDMRPCIYVFAPAGGTISNFQTSNGITMYKSEYQNLELGYHIWAPFPLGEKTVITCEVTTAPGVETPLGFNRTPTLQEYRAAA